MHLNPTTAIELHHKISIVIDEPDLRHDYKTTVAECELIQIWCDKGHIPEDAPDKLVAMIAGEMDNAADIALEQYRSCPKDHPSSGPALYAARQFRQCVNTLNKRLPKGMRIGWDDFDEPETVATPVRTAKPERCDLGHIAFYRNDGGRAAAGFKGKAGDCVCRAVTIAGQLDYRTVYDRLAAGMAAQRRSKRVKKQPRSARNGIYTKRKWFKDYMAELGAVWTPTMQIGSGCTVHLRDDELPLGRLVVALSGHYAAVVNGALHDTYDCSRGGTRCVYGYWTFTE